MKKLADFTIMMLFAVILTACTTPTPISPTTAPAQTLISPDGLIRPGDKIGEMSMEQGVPALPYPYLWDFCDYAPDGQEPATFTTDCNVPHISGVAVQFGWLAKETRFDSNWDAMSWELSMDGFSVALDDFEWVESVYPQHGDENKERHWIINLKNLSPGKHALRLSWTSKLAVDDGFVIYQPGAYEHVVNFTVLEKAEYPQLSSTPNIGQHPYTSEKAHLDFLLYLPGEYGKDPHQEWPLLIYLHGAHLRGVTLDLLSDTPLLNDLKRKSDFPFIVVSPRGDGEYEFWAKDEMRSPLFTLLEEIQNAYSVDPKRIVLMGDGMGGNGVWMFGLNDPEYFAALVPVGGYIGYPFEVPDTICALKDVPVWAFHGGKDVMVPAEIEQELVDALNACGGHAQITVKPDMTINILHKVYTNPELYEWLLARSRK